MKAPFPYFGGKIRWAPEIWKRFGSPDVYVEPFAGSIAVLLANPVPAGREIVSDTEGMICNFWRAVTSDPDKVSDYSLWPTVHQDLTARHKWLREWKRNNSWRFSEDPDYYDAKVAGWYAWGMSQWIGRGFMVAEWDQIPYSGGSLGGGQGVQLQTKFSLSIDARFADLARRMERVIVLNRDWSSCVTPSMLMDNKVNRGMEPLNRCVFLDPPYCADDRQVVYGSDFRGTSEDDAVSSWEWALQHGDRYRIAYCCREGDFDVPDDWHVITRDFGNTYNRSRSKRESVLFSPACEETAQSTLW